VYFKMYMQLALRYFGHWWTGTNRHDRFWGFRYSLKKNVMWF